MQILIALTAVLVPCVIVAATTIADRHRGRALERNLARTMAEQEAEAEAVHIVAQAKAEAEALAKDAEMRVAEFVQRRTAQAEQKIAQAEAQAQADVKAAAAEAAVKAAEIILKAETTGETAAQFLVKGIADMKAGLGA